MMHCSIWYFKFLLKFFHHGLKFHCTVTMKCLGKCYRTSTILLHLTRTDYFLPRTSFHLNPQKLFSFCFVLSFPHLFKTSQNAFVDKLLWLAATSHVRWFRFCRHFRLWGSQSWSLLECGIHLVAAARIETAAIRSWEAFISWWISLIDFSFITFHDQFLLKLCLDWLLFTRILIPNLIFKVPVDRLSYIIGEIDDLTDYWKNNFIDRWWQWKTIKYFGSNVQCKK